MTETFNIMTEVEDITYSLQKIKSAQEALWDQLEKFSADKDKGGRLYSKLNHDRVLHLAVIAEELVEAAILKTEAVEDHLLAVHRAEKEEAAPA